MCKIKMYDFKDNNPIKLRNIEERLDRLHAVIQLSVSHFQFATLDLSEINYFHTEAASNELCVKEKFLSQL